MPFGCGAAWWRLRVDATNPVTMAAVVRANAEARADCAAATHRTWTMIRRRMKAGASSRSLTWRSRRAVRMVVCVPCRSFGGRWTFCLVRLCRQPMTELRAQANDLRDQCERP